MFTSVCSYRVASLLSGVKQKPVMNPRSETRFPLLLMGFPGGSEVKGSACNARDPGSIPVSGRSPGEGNGNSLQYSCLENPMDRGALVGYSPWDPKESDTTE